MTEAMFEVLGGDVGSLTDSDLRTVVARLALAELRSRGAPLSAVTAGGDQDAPDGGLDVRVECPARVSGADFVPRATTGFQVKRPDMPPGQITKEMRPDGVLRPVIETLADVCGAYIIVSAQGSVADKPLGERRRAMREALHDLPLEGQLHTDFYDRDRLATWINEYPGIAAWVKARTGRGTAGWSSVGEWSDAGVSGVAPYLFDDCACLVDEGSGSREALTVSEGIVRLRAALRMPKRCIRLIGLSGLGKTRLVQALFEGSVGRDALDPGVAVYTDYATGPEPTAHDMARRLVASGQRGILIVDNCNPATHADLARICSESASNVSLLTVEYDVKDDEPERTEVFRLRSSAPALVARWLKGQFPDVSQGDRERIAEFSDGNFRVARAVAETLGRGETLGKLKSRELFERIFHQRNQHDRSLLDAAEELALLYSVDGEDTGAGGELATIASIRGIGASRLYGALVELGRRGIAQSRGRWRAILPHAIANPLASLALGRMPPEDFDLFAAALTPRMLKSLSRRLGYLHDDRNAGIAVARWLRTDGPLGDLLSLGEAGVEIVANVAPVAPEVVLAKLEAEFDAGTDRALLASGSKSRWLWIRLIKSLAYEEKMFEQAAALLARIVAMELPDVTTNSARSAFGELYQLQLSGTKATPEQRRTMIDRLARSGDAGLRGAAAVALEALLGSRQFSASSDVDFGARSRDWGWQPATNGDSWNWYVEAIRLAVDLAPLLDEARTILAASVRDLWLYPACRDALDRAATILVAQKPWIQGWLAFRAALKFGRGTMGADAVARLETIIERLRPSDLLHQARAIVLAQGSGWDVADCEPDDGDVMRPWRRASERAQEIGRSLANAPDARRLFVGELLIAAHAHRAFECGRGLAEGAGVLGPLWEELTGLFDDADPVARNATVLGGFINGAKARDPHFVAAALDAVISHRSLATHLPYLQGRVAVDRGGITRLRRAVAVGSLRAESFTSMANGVVGDCPSDALGELLLDIATLEHGVEVALDVLHMRLHHDSDEGREPDAGLLVVARDLLRRTDFSSKGVLRDYGLNTVIRLCCSGEEGEATARNVCERIRTEMETVFLSAHDLGYVLKALFETQPYIALDVFLLPGAALRNRRLFEMDLGFGGPVEEMEPSILRRWADLDAKLRYPLLGRSIGMFKRKHGEEEDDVAPLFLDVLDGAPDKLVFLGDFGDRLRPTSWSGSLADVLSRRRMQVLNLNEHPAPEVRGWVADVLPRIDKWIERERTRDRSGEESFE